MAPDLHHLSFGRYRQDTVGKDNQNDLTVHEGPYRLGAIPMFHSTKWKSFLGQVRHIIIIVTCFSRLYDATRYTHFRRRQKITTCSLQRSEAIVFFRGLFFGAQNPGRSFSGIEGPNYCSLLLLPLGGFYPFSDGLPREPRRLKHVNAVGLC